MRGNWEESAPLALSPESHHQQQQSPPPPSSPDKPSMDRSTATLAKEQQNQQEVAAYPVTTPAWANIGVKEEPQDEKNNDSGISPGHYTSDTASPNSDRLMMAGVSGLSPNSASSSSPEPRLTLDANNVSNGTSNMNETPYDYSRPNRRRRRRQSAASSVSAPSPDYMSRGASISPPIQQNNDSNNNEGPEVAGKETVDGIEQPIVNSQGKIKTFRCKQCSYVAVTKSDFWNHTSGHIKPEKLLTCPKCPFVTEYKHHLEYHLRNHFGSKPYKCDKCNYTCVNKSMLNSHLKSHSNVYQFRCADCAYATKYCHSLKLHLRKYRHKPAMVLNADGTPNPLPIIDIYGTRRGPKTKPKRDEAVEQPQQPMPQAQPQQQQQQQQNQQPMAQQQSPPPSLVNGLLPAMLTPTLTPQFHFNAMNGINTFNGFNGTNALSVAATMPFLPFAYNQIFGRFPMANPFVAVAANNLMNATGNNNFNGIANGQEAIQTEPVNYSQQALMNGGGIMTNREASPISYNGEPSTSSVHVNAVDEEGPVDLSDTKSSDVAPLDLSKPNKSKQVTRLPGSTSRRKGRAVKLDRRLLENDSDEDMPQEQKIDTPPPPPPPLPPPPPVEANVYMEIKHLRTDMRHMLGYICKLQENITTRQ